MPGTIFSDNRILAALVAVRDHFDSIWIKADKELSNHAPVSLIDKIYLSRIRTFTDRTILRSRYPKGYCSPITRILFDAMNTDAFYEHHPLLTPIQSYFKSGDARVIWGACRGLYFQTAMQLGEWYVDVANDTVDVTKTKVEIHRMDSPECPFRFIKDLKTYITIKESYHGVSVYRNSVFPGISTYYPLISISNSDNNLEIEQSLYPYGLSKTDPEFVNTLNSLPQLPQEIKNWILQQPELQSYIISAPGRTGPAPESQKLQHKLEVTAINSLFEKRGAGGASRRPKSEEIKFLTPIFFVEKTQRQK